MRQNPAWKALGSRLIPRRVRGTVRGTAHNDVGHSNEHDNALNICMYTCTSRYCAAACGAAAGERSRRHHDGGNAGYCCSVPRCDGSCLPHPQRGQRNTLGGVCPHLLMYPSCKVLACCTNTEIQAAVGNARDEYLLQERIPLANWKVSANYCSAVLH